MAPRGFAANFRAVSNVGVMEDPNMSGRPWKEGKMMFKSGETDGYPQQRQSREQWSAIVYSAAVDWTATG